MPQPTPSSRADRRTRPRRLERLREALARRREARAYRAALRRVACQYPVRREEPRP
jgi:hypothetical protein